MGEKVLSAWGLPIRERHQILMSGLPVDGIRVISSFFLKLPCIFQTTSTNLLLLFLVFNLLLLLLFFNICTFFYIFIHIYSFVHSLIGFTHGVESQRGT